jgi:hypothetical protein
MDAVPLNTYIYGSIAPDQVMHRLGDDGWSSFDFGPFRVQVPKGDLTRIRAAKTLAQVIAAQGAMWERDLDAIEAALVEAEQAKVAEAVQTTGSQPAVPADPSPDAPYGGDDPELDKKVAAVASLPETRRRTTRAPKDEK